MLDTLCPKIYLLCKQISKWHFSVYVLAAILDSERIVFPVHNYLHALYVYNYMHALYRSSLPLSHGYIVLLLVHVSDVLL